MIYKSTRGGYMKLYPNDKGTFFLVNIIPGRYELAISAQGYRGAIVEDIVFDFDNPTVQIVTLNLKECLCTKFERVKSEDNIFKLDDLEGPCTKPERFNSEDKIVTLHDLESMTIADIKSAIEHVEVDTTYLYCSDIIYTVDGISVDDNYDLYEGFTLIIFDAETNTYTTRAEYDKVK